MRFYYRIWARLKASRIEARDAAIEREWRRAAGPHATIGDRIEFNQRMRS